MVPDTVRDRLMGSFFIAVAVTVTTGGATLSEAGATGSTRLDCAVSAYTTAQARTIAIAEPAMVVRDDSPSGRPGAANQRRLEPLALTIRPSFSVAAASAALVSIILT